MRRAIQVECVAPEATVPSTAGRLRLALHRPWKGRRRREAAKVVARAVPDAHEPDEARGAEAAAREHDAEPVLGCLSDDRGAFKGCV